MKPVLSKYITIGPFDGSNPIQVATSQIFAKDVFIYGHKQVSQNGVPTNNGGSIYASVLSDSKKLPLAYNNFLTEPDGTSAPSVPAARGINGGDWDLIGNNWLPVSDEDVRVSGGKLVYNNPNGAFYIGKRLKAQPYFFHGDAEWRFLSGSSAGTLAVAFGTRSGSNWVYNATHIQFKETTSGGYLWVNSFVNGSIQPNIITQGPVGTPLTDGQQAAYEIELQEPDTIIVRRKVGNESLEFSASNAATFNQAGNDVYYEWHASNYSDIASWFDILSVEFAAKQEPVMVQEIPSGKSVQVYRDQVQIIDLSKIYLFGSSGDGAIVEFTEV